MERFDRAGVVGAELSLATQNYICSINRVCMAIAD
jgi:hypothetical protein